MNLYLVISEELSATVPILDDGTGPKEYGCIACLVAAETRGKAKYAAWKTDKDLRHGGFGTFTGDPIDMPKFSVKKKLGNVDVPAGEYSYDDRFSAYWHDSSEDALD